MSRIGKQPIELPSEVTVTIEGSLVRVKGPQRELQRTLPEGVLVEMQDGKTLVVRVAGEEKALRAQHGTWRSLLANMVRGVVQPYNKALAIQGVGFKVVQEGRKLTFSLGFSHTIEYEVPEDVTVQVTDGTSLTVTGPDKQRVGQVSARIRSFCPPEPYKGKGIRYVGEHVRHKAGKTVA